MRWPPETFVGWKLEGLAARGMRVTLASNQIFEPGCAPARGRARANPGVADKRGWGSAGGGLA